MSPSCKVLKFDPLAPGLSQESGLWLWATALQAVFTCVLLALAKYSEGYVWEHLAKLIVILGIVATWSLALRTIRERLVELNLHWMAVPVNEVQETYIKAAIWRLRIIAAGLTIPFFVMPAACSLISMIFSFELKPQELKGGWGSFAFFTMFSACIVAAYFHWVIVLAPAPVPVRVRMGGTQRRRFAHRMRRRY